MYTNGNNCVSIASQMYVESYSTQANLLFHITHDHACFGMIPHMMSEMSRTCLLASLQETALERLPFARLFSGQPSTFCRWDAGRIIAQGEGCEQVIRMCCLCFGAARGDNLLAFLGDLLVPTTQGACRTRRHCCGVAPNKGPPGIDALGANVSLCWALQLAIRSSLHRGQNSGCRPSGSFYTVRRSLHSQTNGAHEVARAATYFGAASLARPLGTFASQLGQMLSTDPYLGPRWARVLLCFCRQ